MIKQLFLFLSIPFFLFSCNNESVDITRAPESKSLKNADTFTALEFHKNLEDSIQQRLLIDIASRVLRKPDAATWQTKFNNEFRAHFEKKTNELEWIYSIQQEDTVFFYLIRDGRDNKGRANRGVGGKMSWDGEFHITYFEEIFVTKIIDRVNLERIGRDFLLAIKDQQSSRSFLENNPSAIEWPDGRLFYSVEKSEWRYVD
jgi:hypothetical protein